MSNVRRVAGLERTSVYVLASIVVSLIGLVGVQASGDDPAWLSISASLVAAGLTSVAFAIIRYLDEQNAEQSASEVKATIDAISSAVVSNGDALQGLRRNLVLTTADEGRIFDRHPEDEVAELIDSSEGHLEIDVCGLTLRPFCRDQLARILARGNATVRLLVQHPGSETFAQVCDQESRDHRRMVEEALFVTKAALENGSESNSKLTVIVRWFEELPTITMARVDGVIYARPRFLREAHQARIFYERYVQEEGAPYEIYRAFFLSAWDSGISPSIDLVSQIAERFQLEA